MSCSRQCFRYLRPSCCQIHVRFFLHLLHHPILMLNKSNKQFNNFPVGVLIPMKWSFYILTVKNIHSNYVTRETITSDDRDPPWITKKD